MPKVFRTDVNQVSDGKGNVISQQTVQVDITAETIQQRALAAIAGNQAYLGHAAIPAGAALTTTQLTTAVRLMVAQVDALTRQNGALIRLLLAQFDDASDT